MSNESKMIRGKFSVGLTSTVLSLLRDDEDFQIMHAQQLLTYLSYKGYYPPDSIINIILDLIKSKRSKDEALAFQIMEILSLSLNTEYLIGLNDWDLFLTSIISLRYHLSGEETDGYGKEKRFQFLISKLLVSHFISSYSIIPYTIDSERNRKSKIIDEMMNLMQYCDLETFKELIKFLIIIYKNSQIPHINTLPLICDAFESMKQFNRKVLFSQLLEPGKVKNQLITEFIEGIFPSSFRNRNSSKALVEDLSTWFIKLVKKNFKKQNSSSHDIDDSLNESMESIKSLYSMDLDLQEPVGKYELFIVLCTQLYQSSIITASEDSTKEINWNTIYNGYKEFSNLIFDYIQDGPNSICNPDLIKVVLNDLDIILEYKSLSN